MDILLVDDSKTMRMIQRKALAALEGVTITEAGDGVEAMAAINARTKLFDLIILDWNMPNMNGIELVTKIRETDKVTLLIMATTEAEKPRVLDALRAGVNNYVVKPFTGDSLLEKVRTTLAKVKAA